MNKLMNLQISFTYYAEKDLFEFRAFGERWHRKGRLTMQGSFAEFVREMAASHASPVVLKRWGFKQVKGKRAA